MSRLKLAARAAGEHVYASIGHEAGAHALLVSVEDAEQWGRALLAAVDEAKGRPLFTRCPRCLPTGTCSCPPIEDCISKGRA